MTVTCHSCNGRLDVENSSLPKSGQFQNCPHCGIALSVRPPSLSRPLDSSQPGRKPLGPLDSATDLMAPSRPSESPDAPTPKNFFDELPAPKRSSNPVFVALPPEADWALPEMASTAGSRGVVAPSPRVSAGGPTPAFGIPSHPSRSLTPVMGLPTAEMRGQPPKTPPRPRLVTPSPKAPPPQFAWPSPGAPPPQFAWPSPMPAKPAAGPPPLAPPPPAAPELTRPAPLAQPPKSPPARALPPPPSSTMSWHAAPHVTPPAPTAPVAPRAPVAAAVVTAPVAPVAPERSRPVVDHAVQRALGASPAFGAALPGLDDLSEDDLMRANEPDSSVDLPVPKGFRSGQTGPIARLSDSTPDLLTPRFPVASPRPPAASPQPPVAAPRPPAVLVPRMANPAADEEHTPLPPPAFPVSNTGSQPFILEEGPSIRARPRAASEARVAPSSVGHVPPPALELDRSDDATGDPAGEIGAIDLLISIDEAAPVPPDFIGYPTLPAPLEPPKKRVVRVAKPRLGRVALVAGGGALLLAGGFGAALHFSDLPPSGKKREEVERSLVVARRLFSDDTVVSYRKAAAVLRELADADPRGQVPRALQAEAQLCVALAGLKSEIKLADRRLAELSSTPRPADAPEIAKARALRALVDGKLGDAETALRALLKTPPPDAAAAVYLGWTELSLGNPQQAADAFKQALSVEPRRAQALYGLAEAEESLHLATGGPAWATSAAELYKRVLRESPAHLGAALGLERMQKGDPASSERRVHDLLDKQGAAAGTRALAAAWSMLASTAEAGGRLTEAEQRFRKALAIDPSLSAATRGLAHILCTLHRAKEALGLAEGLAKAEPKSGAALLTLAEAQLGSEQFSAAIRSLVAAQKLAPAAEVAALRGRVEEARSDPGANARAIDFYRSAIAADPHAVEPAMALSRLLARTGRTDEAKSVLEQAEKEASSDPGMRDRLGEAYLATGDLEKAEAAFRDVIARAPEIVSARFHLGETLERAGRLDDAAALYAELSTVEKDAPGLLERRASLALLRGRLDDALALYSQALLPAAHPAPPLIAAAGAAWLRAGKPENAKPLFERAVSEDDRCAAGHLGLARLAILASHFDEAETEARRSITLGGPVEAHLALGQADEGLGHYAEARAEYLVAGHFMATAPRGDHAETVLLARLGSARVLIKNGAVKDGLIEAQALVKDHPDRAEAWVLVGDCQEELNQSEKARRSYEAALKKNPDSAEAAFKLARADADEGKDTAAAQLLDRALLAGGGQASFFAEAFLLDGDLHRRLHERAPAIAAYKKFLTLAKPDAPGRKVAEGALRALEAE